MGPDLADRLEAAAAEATAVLRQIAATSRDRDWVDEVVDAGGDGLKSDEAAYVAGVHVDTLRRRAEAAALTDRPIGYLMAGSAWLISLRRLLDAIERRDGKPARLAAETRARKNAELRLLSEKSAGSPITAAG
jgi:hypothetical protein